MNILIVGNGFDLSHYLPTKYDHFMDVMRAIIKKDLGKPIQDVFNNSVDTFPELISKVLDIKSALDEKSYQMNFNELFFKSRDIKFINKTKQIYDTTAIVVDFEDLVEFQYKLKQNCWFQYFNNHVEKIKTWIDFEIKIEEVLGSFGKLINSIDSNNLDFNNLDLNLYDFLDKNCIKVLEHFPIFKEVGGVYKVNGKNFAVPKQLYLNSKFCHGEAVTNGFSSSSFLEYLIRQLDDFIEIFNSYLELIIDKLKPLKKLELFMESKSLLELGENCWMEPNVIYSFNYTNTYQRLHNLVRTEYLHGSHGENQNIVLGISDLDDDTLKKIKAFGFTKYHQKLFKDTDYLFLDIYKKKIKQHNLKIEYFEKDFGDSDPTAKKLARQNLMDVDSKLNLNVQVWGHSLDVSDKDYIIDLFSLNDDMDRNVRVIIFYFDKQAKFSLLNNLLAILGKDKVEQWMKNKWLEFKPNPEVKFEVDSNLEEAS
ncbi:MAG: AbiH family protein [Acinetobacter amyesii]|uniref:AbiH family protein n=1 Tax=Acinetobacter amyesii TaxID=2942470 RepID=UPI003D041B03